MFICLSPKVALLSQTRLVYKSETLATNNVAFVVSNKTMWNDQVTTAFPEELGDDGWDYEQDFPTLVLWW